MQESQQPLIIVINNIEIKVDPRFAELSGYLKGLASITAQRKIFQLMIKFIEMNNYKDFYTPKVKLREPREVMSQDNANFFQQLSKKLLLNKLFEAAFILDVRCLKDCCASYIACLIYFEKNNVIEYESVKQKLMIKCQLTPNISAELKNKYQLLLNQ